MEENPKRICISMAVCAFLTIVLCGVILPGGDDFLAAVSGSIEEKPIYGVDTEKKEIAFSFDATWGAEHTLEILDILDKNNVKTTFFLVNIWMEEYPDMVREIHKRGHEIQLHSATHPYFTDLSPAAMKSELQQNNAKIKELVGEEGTLFRPPFGDYNTTVVATAKGLGLTVVQWSVDSLDWQDISASEICSRVKNGVGNGSIVLFHNNGLHTAEAISVLCHDLQEEGYAIVPVSALLYQKNYTVDNNGIQHLVK